MESKLRFEHLSNDLLKCPICGFVVSKFERKKVYNHAFKKHHGQISTKLNELTAEEKILKNKFLTAQRVKKCRLLKKLCTMDHLSSIIVDAKTTSSTSGVMPVVVTSSVASNEVDDHVMSSSTAVSLSNHEDDGPLRISHHHPLHHQHEQYFMRQQVDSYTSSLFTNQFTDTSSNIEVTHYDGDRDGDQQGQQHQQGQHQQGHQHQQGQHRQGQQQQGQQQQQQQSHQHKRKNKQSMLDGLKLFKQRASESIARIFTTPASVMNHHHPTNDHHQQQQHQHQQQQQMMMITNHEVLQTPSMMMMTMASGSNEDDLIQEDIISIMGVDSITKALQDNNHHDTFAVPDGKIFFVRKASSSSSLGSLSLAGSSEKILASRNNSNVILSSRNNSAASYLSFIWTTRDNSNASIV